MFKKKDTPKAPVDPKLVQWQTFFKSHDKDGNGELEAHEFKALHESLIKNNIPVPNDAVACFREIDVDETNTITFDEFAGYLTALKNRIKKQSPPRTNEAGSKARCIWSDGIFV